MNGASYDAAGNMTADPSGTRVASYPTAASGTAATYFEHQNWLGTERMRTAYNGAVVETLQSLPFGDGGTESGTASWGNDQSDYATLDYDAESNSEHAQYRQYAESEGRWFSPDPYSGSYDFTNPQSFNRYSYAGNNPLNYIDANGLDGVDPNTVAEGAIPCGEQLHPMARIF